MVTSALLTLSNISRNNRVHDAHHTQHRRRPLSPLSLLRTTTKRTAYNRINTSDKLFCLLFSLLIAPRIALYKYTRRRLHLSDAHLVSVEFITHYDFDYLFRLG